jgi:hypothetical protein
MATDTAANIVKGVVDKSSPANGSNGKDLTPPPKPTDTSPVDPNAGKEKYTVDGKDVFLTPEQARAYVQKGIAFEPRMDQLGRLQHETAAFLETLATDPGKVIYNDRFGKPQEVLKKILGSTKISDEIKETLGQWYYENVILPERMSPEQREALEWKAKAQAHDQLLQQHEHERIAAENNVRVNQAMGVLKAQINEAMTEAGVPLDAKIAPQLAKRVAQVMQSGYMTGRMVTPKDAMARVKSEIFEYQKSYYDVLDEDKLVEQLGKDNAEKVRKYYLKAVKEAEKDKTKKDLKPGAKRDERKVMSPDEFHDYLQELKKK